MSDELLQKQSDQYLRWELTPQNEYFLDDFPFTEDQKELALQYAVGLIARVFGDSPFLEWDAWKSYDPLVIKRDDETGQKIAHSYLMDLEDGGRHHPFESISELERQVINDLRKRWQQYFDGGKS